MRRAFTRAVSQRLGECELTHLDRTPIDSAQAAVQHSCYEGALASVGFEIVRLPELADHPDGVFVEDTALILEGQAVITRPGASSRAGEAASSTDGLRPHFPIHYVENGRMDGGDILRIGRKLYAGLSSRTDLAATGSLSAIVEPFGFEVVPVQVGRCLHLKTAATFAGLDCSGTPVLLYDRHSIDPAQFTGVEPIAVAPGEPAAANCMRAGSALIVAAGSPRTTLMLERRGFDVIELDMSEFRKAEAGVTCLSLLDERC